MPTDFLVIGYEYHQYVSACMHEGVPHSLLLLHKFIPGIVNSQVPFMGRIYAKVEKSRYHEYHHHLQMYRQRGSCTFSSFA